LAVSVAPFLDEAALVALLRTCRHMRQIVTSDDIWEGRLKDMRVAVLLVNKTSNFFRAFKSDVVTLRALEGAYDYEADEPADGAGSGASPLSQSPNGASASPVTAVKRVLLTVSPAFLGFVTPVARVCLVVQYFAGTTDDVFEGTMRYSFSRRLFVMSTYLTRNPRQDGPRFDVVVARSARKWGTEKVAHFERVRNGTRLILSIAQPAPGQPATNNGFLPSNELLAVARAPRDGEQPPPPVAALPMDSAGSGGGGGGSAGGSSAVSATSSPPTSEKRFSLRSFFGGGSS
jgi:hypothetical protein